jgi:hypothetical protein
MDLPGLHTIGHSQSCCTDMGFMKGVVGWIQCGHHLANQLADSFPPRIPGTQIQLLSSCACGGVSDGVSDDVLL